jgi:hypothetical protein
LVTEEGGIRLLVTEEGGIRLLVTAEGGIRLLVTEEGGIRLFPKFNVHCIITQHIHRRYNIRSEVIQ